VFHEPRQKLTSQVFRKLLERIATGGLAEGERLPSESELMSQFLAGRSHVRDAIRVLSFLGHVELRQGRGAFVRRSVGSSFADNLADTDLRDVYQVRRVLEGAIVRSAASMRSNSDLRLLQGLIEVLEDSFNSDSVHVFCDVDVTLGSALAVSSRNPVALHLYRSISNVLKERGAPVLLLPGVMGLCLERHKRIYDAILKQDADVAEATAARTLDTVVERIMLADPQLVRSRFDRESVRATKRNSP
jgi:DNA-binding FadR family transcriptional regulator